MTAKQVLPIIPDNIVVLRAKRSKSDARQRSGRALRCRD